MQKSIFFFLFVLSVTFSYTKEDWVAYKNDTLSKVAHIDGWCSKEKALVIMDIIKKKRCLKCVEIGVFSGKSLLPIVKALKYIGKGKLYAIDAWDFSIATKGLPETDSSFDWWNDIDFNKLHEQTLSVIKNNNLQSYCELMHQTSESAANTFENESIDFIHFDGNHNEPFSFNDIVAYFPKVKNKGYILLTDPNWLSMRQPLVYLLERADIVSSFSRSSEFLLLRKNSLRVKNADKLTKAL